MKKDIRKLEINTQLNNILIEHLKDKVEVKVVNYEI